MITAQDIKNHLGLAGTADDAILATYASAVSAFLERKIGRKIAEAEGEEVFDGSDLEDMIFLCSYPVTTLSKLEYRIGFGAWQAFPSDSYELDSETGIIHTNTMYNGERNIRATYTAGFATTPDDLKLAAVKLAAKIYNKRRSDGFSSEEVSGARVEWDKFMTDDIKELIAPFKKRRI